jgi:hypothetical protein
MQCRELSRLRALEETLESLGRDVLLVGKPSGYVKQLLPCQPDKTREIPVPELPRRCLVSGFELLNPLRD